MEEPKNGIHDGSGGRKRSFQPTTNGQAGSTIRSRAAAAAADHQPSALKQRFDGGPQANKEQQQRQQSFASVGIKNNKKGLLRNHESTGIGDRAAAAAVECCSNNKEKTGGLKRPKRPVEHLVEMLGNREVYGGYRKYRRCPRARGPGPRRFYQAIYPNVSITNVETPHCFPRKFSPDGKIMIAYGLRQQSIQIYGYNSVASCGELMNSRSAVLGVQHDDTLVGYSDIGKDLFQTLFKHKFTIPVTGENGNMNIQLNHECALFTADNRFLIIAGSGHACLEEHGARLFRDVSQTYESLEPTPAFGLETMYVYCMDLQEGIEADCKIFKADRIFLSFNEGLYLFGHLLAVLSVMHQTIHLFTIDGRTGKLVPVQKIGYFLYDDDEMFLQHCSPPAQISEFHILGGLKQRILTFLYKLIISRTDESKWTRLMGFYRNWDKLASLKMRKMQLLDVNTFLILFFPEVHITKRSDPAPQFTIYVVYDWKTTEVKAVFDGLSEELTCLYESNIDTFRHPDHEGIPSSSLTNSHAARERHEECRDMILNATMGGPNEVIRCLLSSLPIPAQFFSLTPYMDLELFSYDEQLVSPKECLKYAGDTPIRFYSRMSGRKQFQLHTGSGRLQELTLLRHHQHQQHQQEPIIIDDDDDDPDIIILDHPSINNNSGGNGSGGGNIGNNRHQQHQQEPIIIDDDDDPDIIILDHLSINNNSGGNGGGGGNINNNRMGNSNNNNNISHGEQQRPSTSNNNNNNNNPTASNGGLTMNGGASSTSSLSLSGNDSLVHMIFHPTEPLVISIQLRILPDPRTTFNRRYIVNFHLRAERDPFISSGQ